MTDHIEEARKIADEWCPEYRHGLGGDIAAALAEKDKRIAELEALADKVNDIRNSIIGCQKMNWSEHIYPLVAALNEAGIEGKNYPEAREYVGTMLERTLAAENEVIRLRAQIRYIATQWPETSAGKYADAALAEKLEKEIGNE